MDSYEREAADRQMLQRFASKDPGPGRAHRWIVSPDDAYICDNDCGAEYSPHDGEPEPPGPCGANMYEAAMDRLEAARENARTARQAADDADREYALAFADLTRYESGPGLPLPRYRQDHLIQGDGLDPDVRRAAMGPWEELHVYCKRPTRGTSMIRYITYGIEPDGTVISRVGSEIAFPVLDFEAIGQGGDGYAPGDFRGPARYSLEKYPIHAYFRNGDVTYPQVRWTKGYGNTHSTPPVPLELKNRHRAFWGFAPLKETSRKG
jgi:hypothetical protein